MKQFKHRDPRELLTNIAFLITDVARLYRALFDEKMKERGLKRSEWWLIAFLCYFEGRTQQELHEVMDIGAAGLAKIVDRLERVNLVRRSNDVRDRRAKRIFLTDQSKPIAADIDRTSDQTIERSLSALTGEEQTMLRHLLTKLRNEMLSE